MLFNSLAFLAFAPTVLLGHAFLRGRALRVWLLLMSYVFYGWGQPWWCLGLLFTSTVIDFIVALRINAARTQRSRRAWLLGSLIGNLGLLAAFKYSEFFLRSFNRVLGWASIGAELPVPHVPLPPGISFYTFQTLSYTIDVYRGRMKPARNFLTMALFVAYFPQLVAGPIERAASLMHQLDEKQPRTLHDVMSGVSRILWGLMKKVVFADWLGVFVHHVFGDPASAPSGELWLATYAFAFQIYLDFSAYSDIAIGLARTMGITLQENFRWPYLARNLSEFWRRWHISFSTWLKDYLYIPLGGSRKGPRRTVLNLFIVMLLGGLWHGAANTFILWGLWIGLGLALHHGAVELGFARREDAQTYCRKDVFGIFVTFHWMCLSWVFFRADSTAEAFDMLRRMLFPNRLWAADTSSQEVSRTIILLAIAAAAHAVRGLKLGLRWEAVRSPVATGLLWSGIVVITVLFFAPLQAQFIYFRF